MSQNTLSESTLIHVEPDGRLYMDALEIQWCRVIDGRIYVAKDSAWVHTEVSGRVFLPAPLEYTAWGLVLLETALSTIMSTDASKGVSMTIEIESEAGEYLTLEGETDRIITSDGEARAALRLTGDADAVSLLRAEIRGGD